MALIINTPITLPSGIIVNSSYGRVVASVNPGGTQLYSDLKIYNNKQAYIDNLEEIRIININKYMATPYNRESDGLDTLSIAHDVLVTALLEQGIVAIKELN